MKSTTTKRQLSSSTPNTTTMSFRHESKTMKTLNLLRGEQQPYEVTPTNSEDEDDDSTDQSNRDDEEFKTFHGIQSQNDHDHHSDLYRPLTPEEADEDQLAEFFTALDFDISFGALPLTQVQCETDATIHNDSKTLEEQHTSKRRRLLISSYSCEEEGDDGRDLNLQRKRRAPSMSSNQTQKYHDFF
ncbi:unnamed protein product [Pseudo-nitzschia multistriata]|uniref:Uncharacterized protein n=1 Tax=Pseudo-nitzschia multistriata TaxID=183589 RepID=A0A448ZHM8_9STRA|nr:unnamed protein product [Pseudo-nitzschia multistriata]